MSTCQRKLLNLLSDRANGRMCLLKLASQNQFPILAAIFLIFHIYKMKFFLIGNEEKGQGNT